MTRQLFETYFKKYYSLIYRIAFMQMKGHADAEDVAQEVFVRLLKHHPTFTNEEHEKAWFVRITVNICKDIIKSKWHSTTVSINKIPEHEKSFFQLPYVKEDETISITDEDTGKCIRLSGREIRKNRLALSFDHPRCARLLWVKAE